MTKDAVDLTLAEAVEQIEYGAGCGRCREVRRINLQLLRETLGDSFCVRDIRPHLVCRKCGNREIIVTTLWKSATSTERLMAHWQ